MEIFGGQMRAAFDGQFRLSCGAEITYVTPMRHSSLWGELDVWMKLAPFEVRLIKAFRGPYAYMVITEPGALAPEAKSRGKDSRRAIPITIPRRWDDPLILINSGLASTERSSIGDTITLEDSTPGRSDDWLISFQSTLVSTEKSSIGKTITPWEAEYRRRMLQWWAERDVKQPVIAKTKR